MTQKKPVASTGNFWCKCIAWSLHKKSPARDTNHARCNTSQSHSNHTRPLVQAATFFFNQHLPAISNTPADTLELGNTLHQGGSLGKWRRGRFFFSSSRWMDPWRWTPANVSRFFIEMNIHVLEASSVETFSWRWVLAFVCSKFWNSREFCVFVFGASDHASCSSVFPGWGAFPPTNVP